MSKQNWRGLDIASALQEEYARRFWRKVDSSGDGCWEWLAYRRSNGYGQVMVAPGKYYGAHIVSYALSVGPIPPGHVVCHKCDHPPCVRPEHLFLGTQSENTLDMFSKQRGTRSRGSQRSNARLNEDAVRRIRADVDTPVRLLAQEYGVSEHAIYAVRRREKWAHVD